MQGHCCAIDASSPPLLVVRPYVTKGSIGDRLARRGRLAVWLKLRGKHYVCASRSPPCRVDIVVHCQCRLRIRLLSVPGSRQRLGFPRVSHPQLQHCPPDERVAAGNCSTFLADERTALSGYIACQPDARAEPPPALRSAAWASARFTTDRQA